MSDNNIDQDGTENNHLLIQNGQEGNDIESGPTPNQPILTNHDNQAPLLQPRPPPALIPESTSNTSQTQGINPLLTPSLKNEENQVEYDSRRHMHWIVGMNNLSKNTSGLEVYATQSYSGYKSFYEKLDNTVKKIGMLCGQPVSLNTILNTHIGLSDATEELLLIIYDFLDGEVALNTTEERESTLARSF